MGIRREKEGHKKRERGGRRGKEGEGEMLNDSC